MLLFTELHRAQGTLSSGCKGSSKVLPTHCPHTYFPAVSFHMYNKFSSTHLKRTFHLNVVLLIILNSRCHYTSHFLKMDFNLEQKTFYVH